MQIPSAAQPHNYGSGSGGNYPRQQYYPSQQNTFGTTHHTQPSQPHVVNNFITNNHQTHFGQPGVATHFSPRKLLDFDFKLSANNNIFLLQFSIAIHFTTYHSYPSYYSPFPDYSPISSFGLGMAIGSMGSHHHHDYNNGYNYPRTYHHYHHYDNNGNTNSNSNGVGNVGNANNNGNAANGNITNSYKNFAANDNFNAQNSYDKNNNPNQNMQPNQTSKFEGPMNPIVYSISGQQQGDDEDSTEIIFKNPCLIFGVENLLMIAEFKDQNDVFIMVEQDADGLQPYEYDSFFQPNVTSAKGILSSTVAHINTTMTTTTTVKIDT